MIGSRRRSPIVWYVPWNSIFTVWYAVFGAILASPFASRWKDGVTLA